MTSLAWSPALKGALFTTALSVVVASTIVVVESSPLGYFAAVFAIATGALLFTHARNAQRLEVVA